jgi:hypothetical protein
MSKRIMACAVAFAGVSLASAKASAIAPPLNSPFTNAGISIGMGDGRPIVCFEEGGFGTGGRVTVRTLGGTAGLDDDYHVNGGTGNDSVVFVQSTTSSYCRSHFVSLSPLNYNGNFLDVNGKAGSDIIMGAQGDTVYFGDTGNDLLMTSSPIGQMLGGGNDDLVISISAGGSERLWGDAGNDCLHDMTDTYFTYTCGAGTDSSTNTFHALECENRGVACCLCF